MDGFAIPMVFMLAVGAAIVFRLIAGQMDRGRISEYVSRSGGTVQSIDWAPFGPGWFGEKSDRIYAVQYVDQSGFRHEAHCKTSLTTGVYFTQDQVVGRPTYAQMASPPAPPVADQNWERLVEENARLRARVAELENQRRL